MNGSGVLYMSVLMFILEVIVAIWISKTEAEKDAEKNGKIKHGWSAFWRAVGAIAYSLLLHYSYFDWNNSIFWLFSVIWVALMAVIYWIPFDYVYNVKKEIDPFYRGTTSFIDRVSKYVILKGRGYVIFKFVLLGIVGYIYWSYLSEAILQGLG